MKNTLILVLFPLFVIGVFGADEVSVSVKEGDSVTLHTRVQIQGDDLMEWRFNRKLLFRVSSSAGVITVTDKTNGTFGDRLKVDKLTGDLKITNFRTTDSGEYKLKISSTRGSSETTFNVKGVLNTDRDPVKSVTVGESITLNTQILSDEEIQWRFRAENTSIAEISETANSNPQYHDVPDERFKDRLKLDEDTGSLTIMNIRITDSGVYKADISSSVNSFTIHKTFTVAVSGVQFVSVMEGDSVSLHTGVTKIQSGDEILWKFGDQDVIIPHLNGPDVNQTWINMNVNKRTGDLTINNIKRNQSGDYKVEINTINVISHRKYHINISGVLNTDRDPVKSVTVGESITLKTQILSDEEIQWLFVAENTLIAEISETANRIPQYHDVPDGRFKDRLKLNEDTGSLTITNTRDTHSGVYKADIRSSSFTIHKTFTVAVSVPSWTSTEIILIVVVVVVVLVLGIVIGIGIMIMIGIKKGWFSFRSSSNVNGQNRPVKEEETELSK